VILANAWRREDIAVCLGLAVCLVIYYVGTPVWIWAPAAFVFVALAWWRLDLALLAVVVTAPFYRFPKAFDASLFGLAQRGDPLRFSLAEFAVLGCGLAWLVRHLWRSAKEPPSTTLTWRHLLSPPLAFLVAATLTLPFSQYLTFSFRAYRTIVLEPLLFYFLLRQTVDDGAAVRRTLDAVLALGLGVGLFALGHYLFVGVTEATGGVRRVLAIYHSPNALALLVGRLIPIAIALVAAAGAWRRALAATAALATGATLFLTYSRGAWLAVAGSIVALGWLRGGRARWLAVAATGAALLLAAMLLPSERLQSETTVQQRLYIWQSSWQMLVDHPLVGVGLDNFLYYYPRYMLPQAHDEPNMSHPHNLILDFWLSTGILGLIAFAWLQVTFWRRSRHALGLGAEAGLLAAGLAASMAEMLLHGLIDNSFFLIDLAFFFWLTYGLMAAVVAVPAARAGTEGR